MVELVPNVWVPLIAVLGVLLPPQAPKNNTKGIEANKLTTLDKDFTDNLDTSFDLD
jgi:hypothetical protein